MKILMTSRYGLGWSTYETSYPDVSDYMLTYQPIIDYIEAKEAQDEEHDLSAKHPLVLRMAAEIRQKFGRDPCVLGAESLIVEEISRRALADLLGLDARDGKEFLRV